VITSGLDFAHAPLVDEQVGMADHLERWKARVTAMLPQIASRLAARAAFPISL
jgi:hypothetical protein